VTETDTFVIYDERTASKQQMSLMDRKPLKRVSQTASGSGIVGLDALSTVSMRESNLHTCSNFFAPFLEKDLLIIAKENPGATTFEYDF
jgi:hypothetical protein